MQRKPRKSTWRRNAAARSIVGGRLGKHHLSNFREGVYHADAEGVRYMQIVTDMPPCNAMSEAQLEGDFKTTIDRGPTVSSCTTVAFRAGSKVSQTTSQR